MPDLPPHIQPAGFTIIELLVVMAIFGILATVALLVINPTERIAQANDTEMRHSVSATAIAVEACYTHQGAHTYLGCNDVPSLVSNGFLKATPYPTPLFMLKTASPANSEIRVYGQLNAVSARPGGCANNPYIVYDSTDNSTKVTCNAPPPF